MAQANVSFQYQGPGGSLQVNWWIVTSGGKPAALGGLSSQEVAYKSVVLTGVPPLGSYTVETPSPMVIDAGQFPDSLIGTFDCWIAVYQGEGAAATLLASKGFPTVYTLSAPTPSVTGISATFS